MTKNGFTPEQIINKLREVEVLLSPEDYDRTSQQKDRGNRTDVLPLVEGIRRDEGRASQVPERTGEGISIVNKT